MKFRRALAAAVAAVAILAIACGGDEDPADATLPPAATATPVSAATAVPDATAQPAEATPESEPSATEPALPAPETGFAEVQIERVFPGLAFQRMTGMYQDGAGNWYVTEQAGRIQYIAAGSEDAAIWLDLTDRVDASGNEMGLLGLALAPGFETSGRFYVNYTGGGQTVVSRFQALPDGRAADSASEERLLTVAQPFPNHNGGQIAFGPDGYLYVALGDGGSGNDPLDSGQDIGTLLGAILRIDVSGGDAGYAVPADNPLVGQAGARDEIWAYGLRNPWRFSFDRETGDLWVGDVGQNTREEVNLVAAGGNYGWRIMEGFDCRGGGTACDSDGLLPPVLDYPTGAACSVTGGFVYRGTAIPALVGAYVFSDYCSGIVHALRHVGGVLTEDAQIGASGFLVSSFAEDNEGELYILQHADAGGIYKLVP